MARHTYRSWRRLCMTLFAVLVFCTLRAQPALTASSVNPALWPHDVPDDVPNKEAIGALKPGMRIDKSNWELVKDLLPRGTLDPIKAGQRSIEIGVGHHHTPGTKRYIEESQKNIEGIKLNPDGTLQSLNAWKGGLMFPAIDPRDPQAGIKSMWNWQSRPIGDDRWMPSFKFIQTRGGVEIKSFGCADSTPSRPCWGQLSWFGRTDVAPVPAYPDNPDNLYQMSMISLDHPYDQADTIILFYRYRDAFTDPDYFRNRGDDEYAYVPSVRRVRRVTAAQRTDSFGGSDITFDDIDGYTGTVLENTYKFFNREFQLVMVAEGEEYERRWKAGTIYDPTPSLNIPYEVRLTYKIEATHKSSSYIYGKRVMWLDGEGWQVDAEEIYDRAGKHWKTFTLTGQASKATLVEGVTLHTAGSMMYDHQNNTSTMTFIMTHGQTFQLGMTPETFALESLRKKGR